MGRSGFRIMLGRAQVACLAPTGSCCTVLVQTTGGFAQAVCSAPRAHRGEAISQWIRQGLNKFFVHVQLAYDLSTRPELAGAADIFLFQAQSYVRRVAEHDV